MAPGHMTHWTIIALYLLAASVGLPATAGASEFNRVLTDQSTLTFSFKQMGVGLQGRFKKFDVQFSFDPDNVDSATASVDVDLASIDTGSIEGDDEVAGRAWFHTKAYPTAHFASTRFKSLGAGRFEVAGLLSIKGRTKAVTPSGTLTLRGNEASLEGAFVIRRGDFAIGEGPWADFGIVANEVQIRFHIVATRRK